MYFNNIFFRKNDQYNYIKIDYRRRKKISFLSRKKSFHPFLCRVIFKSRFFSFVINWMKNPQYWIRKSSNFLLIIWRLITFEATMATLVSFLTFNYFHLKKFLVKFVKMLHLNLNFEESQTDFFFIRLNEDKQALYMLRIQTMNEIIIFSLYFIFGSVLYWFASLLWCGNVETVEDQTSQHMET